MRIAEFPHRAPKGYSYSFEEVKKNVLAIWLCHNCKYDYNLGKPVRTIWGFYNQKSKSYFAPINAKTIGKSVNISNTTPYTSMPINYKGVEQYFV